ncbi:hypothetical protein [Streptomyces sp. ALB3]|uniref:hypothetical protein n=1 Tax=Streptomyces sp. ALB3 TaxID=3374278 RepID=UPI003797C464
MRTLISTAFMSLDGVLRLVKPPHSLPATTNRTAVSRATSPEAAPERDHPHSHRELGYDLTRDCSHQLLDLGRVRCAVNRDLETGHFPSALDLHAFDSDPVVAVASHRHRPPARGLQHIQAPVRAHRPEEDVVIGGKQVLKHTGSMPT